jgi:hypothetical protein
MEIKWYRKPIEHSHTQDEFQASGDNDTEYLHGLELLGSSDVQISYEVHILVLPFFRLTAFPVSLL